MSMIDKLIIRGVRSFGIKVEDEQLITFSAPLTLILGANGSGKTTIIECLKYALTGELPPGSDKGKSFVHDPKIFDTRECLGRVKLKVKNIKNEYLTITRGMKTSCKKGGKLSFETLDSTITFEKDGQRGSVNRRCVDVNTEIPQFMGVSKAIINNVIFCHQEDSNWPLEEGKKLKEKFDAIFGTTEYNKAIEKIIQIRKAKEIERKQKENEIRYLLDYKNEAEKKTLDLDKEEKKLKTLQENFEIYKLESITIESRLAAIIKQELEIGRNQRERTELKTKLKNCSDHRKNLVSKIKKIFDGNLDLLDKEIRSFKHKINEKHGDVESLEKKIVQVKNKEKNLRESLTNCEKKSAGLILQRQQEQDYLSERAEKMQSLCKDLSINIGIDLEALSEETENIIQDIASGIKQRDDEVVKIAATHEKADSELQVEIDRVRVDQASVESDISSKSSQRSDLEKQKLKVKAEINTVENSASTLESVTRDIERLEAKLEESSKSIDLEAVKSSIDERKVLIKNMDEELQNIDDKLTFLNSFTKLKAEINLKGEELDKRESEIRRVKSKNSDNIKKIFNQKSVENNFKRNLQDCYAKLQKEIHDLTQDVNRSKLKEKELQIKRKNQKDELAKFEKELEQNEDRIFDEIHSGSYEQILAKTKENVEKLQLEFGALKTAESMYTKYINKIDEDPCCPLCHKNMTSNEASDLTNELNDEIRRLPSSIQTTEQQLTMERKKYERLLELRSTIEKVDTLKKNIPKCKQDLRKIEEELADVANSIESLQMTICEPNSLLEIAASLSGDMSLLDEAMKESARLNIELQALKEKLPETDSNMTLEDVQKKKSTLVIELKSLRSDLEKEHNFYQTQTDVLNKLREKRNNLKDKQIKLQEGMQAITQLKQRCKEIDASIEKIVEELHDLRQKLQPLKKKLESLNLKKQKLRMENKSIIQEMTTKVDNLKRKSSDIHRLTKELKNMAKLNLVEQIKQNKNERNKYLEDQKEMEKSQEELLKQLGIFKKEILNQEIEERDLIDNRELKLIDKETDELKVKYDRVSNEIGEQNYDAILKEKEQLNCKNDEIKEKRGELSGQTGEIKSKIKELQKELHDPKYKNSLKNYRKSLYDLLVMKKLIGDLGQYRVALENALIKFHSDKMQKINRLIREFWRQIYRGNDIDFIQILTETDDTKADNADKKRSYSYRVVQSKNNSLIDMRGRCSAGQRVLASLIIRMALAETFSSNCGVLALDEPTTNLDRENILSLCEALNRIVEERQVQTNFMLIIITHDEEFINTLGKVGYYCKVFRNDEGKSVIRTVLISN